MKSLTSIKSRETCAGTEYTSRDERGGKDEGIPTSR
jgi:hypothetical protein